MKVAIIGAGVSGLACAIELERHSVMPDIFEQRRCIGERVDYVSAFLQVMHKPVFDQLGDLRENYSISLNPLNRLTKIVMFTPKTVGTVTGRNLGYFVRTGQGQDTVAGQLFRQVKSPVRYNVRADQASLAPLYDHVVVASGDHGIARTMGCWQDVSASWIIGATVLGNFDPNTLKMWLNTDYARSGYAYLSPFDRRSASLCLAVTGAGREDIDGYWKKFWDIEKFRYEVVSLWDMQHVAGRVYPKQAGNTLFVGNAGGFIEPFLGFGLYSGMVSGVLAARAIVEGKPFTEYTAQLEENLRISAVLRKELDRFANRDFDRLVAFLTTHGVRQLVYNTNLDVNKYTACLVGLKDRVKSLSPLSRLKG